ncbi:MAG: DNA-binding protein [Pseudozobellia sp.]|nr:DNA-binding protein [Pseudozobellia sp.]|tara:strand:- start:2009 stop:2386 length:378 start_codon:yes stop_codon:yes gene_type:complete
MVKITAPADCDNTPKKKFLKEFNVAFAEADVDYFHDKLTDDVVWNMVGDKIIEGKENFIAALLKMKEYTAKEVKIESIITHGRFAAVNGTMVMNKGNVFAFADFYEFRGAKGNLVKKLTSYVVEK